VAAAIPAWRRLLALLAGTPGSEPGRAARPARRRRRTTKPDFQRARVYRWEGVHVLPRSPAILPLDDCRELVHAAYLWAERPPVDAKDWQPPIVTDGRGRRHACGSRQVIKLPRWARTRPVVLHECAHGLAPDKHGPRFMGVYVALLERFMGIDPATLEQSLRADGIQVAPMGGSRPRRRRAA
jgi:hypothetical protein